MPKQVASKEVSEKRVWEWLETARKRDKLDVLHMERVENLVGEGTPDVQGCYQRGYFDIELKSASRPANTETPIIPIAADPRKAYIRSTQKIWHTRGWKAGRSCHFLVQVGRDREVCRYLISGDQAYDIEGKTEDELNKMAHYIDGYGGDPLRLIIHASNYR